MARKRDRIASCHVDARCSRSFPRLYRKGSHCRSRGRPCRSPRDHPCPGQRRKTARSPSGKAEDKLKTCIPGRPVLCLYCFYTLYPYFASDKRSLLYRTEHIRRYAYASELHNVDGGAGAIPVRIQPPSGYGAQLPVFVRQCFREPVSSRNRAQMGIYAPDAYCAGRCLLRCMASCRSGHTELEGCFSCLPVFLPERGIRRYILPERGLQLLPADERFLFHSDKSHRRGYEMGKCHL